MNYFANLLLDLVNLFFRNNKKRNKIMNLLPLDLSKLSYPKPTPPPPLNDPFNPEFLSLVCWQNIVPRYQNEVAKWNTHQAQVQDAAQKWTAQQQKMNDKYSDLLKQYEGLQKEFIAEKEAHAKETQEIQKLKADMLKITEILYNVLKEPEVKQENMDIKNHVEEIKKILDENLIVDKK
jgi:hypothetical protein